MSWQREEKGCCHAETEQVVWVYLVNGSRPIRRKLAHCVPGF